MSFLFFLFLFLFFLKQPICFFSPPSPQIPSQSILSPPFQQVEESLPHLPLPCFSLFFIFLFFIFASVLMSFAYFASFLFKKCKLSLSIYGHAHIWRRWVGQKGIDIRWSERGPMGKCQWCIALPRHCATTDDGVKA